MRPTFDHNLCLSVELNRVTALSMQRTEEAILPAAERGKGHGGSHADVDAGRCPPAHSFSIMAKSATISVRSARQGIMAEVGSNLACTVQINVNSRGR